MLGRNMLRPYKTSFSLLSEIYLAECGYVCAESVNVVIISANNLRRDTPLSEVIDATENYTRAVVDKRASDDAVGVCLRPADW
jgi:hypothetical protein